ncbi:hypothetical protein [Candidatus Nephthysia bennettiae]
MRSARPGPKLGDVPRTGFRHYRAANREAKQKGASWDRITAFTEPVQTVPIKEEAMRFGSFKFGSIQVDGVTYEYDVVIDGGSVRKRKKKPSKPFRGVYGHTPLSAAEDIPWKCRRLVVGTGAHGGLPIMEDVEREAHARQVELLVVPTAQAIEEVAKAGKETNAILHVTC